MGTGNGLSDGERSIMNAPRLRPRQTAVKETANIELEVDDISSLEETTLNDYNSFLPRGLHHDKLKSRISKHAVLKPKGLHHDKLKSRMLEHEVLKSKGLHHDKLKSRMPEHEVLKPKGLHHDKKIMKKMPVKKAKHVKSKLKMNPAKMHGLMNNILYKK